MCMVWYYARQSTMRCDERVGSAMNGAATRGGGNRYLSGQFPPTMRKHLWKVVMVLLVVLVVVVYVRYYWVLGTGVKAGELNYVVHKGFLFKTYEGKMIQTGIRSQNGTLESFEFEFSVERPEVANELMVNSGKQFNLHYREYLGALPWRGHKRYVVDSIISMETISR